MSGGEWMTKKTLITVVTVSVLSGGLVAATNAFAQTPVNGQNGVSSFIQEIAKQNNVTVQYLRPFGLGRGFKKVGWHKPKATPTPAQ